MTAPNHVLDHPVVRVKAKTRILGAGVPDSAKHGDLVIGNRGAAACVRLDERTSVVYLEYIGNISTFEVKLPKDRVHDFR